jgi:hypothetical protein
MNRQDWLLCVKPLAMLDFIESVDYYRLRPSDPGLPRQLRLVAVAVEKKWWEDLLDCKSHEHIHKGLYVGELVADGILSPSSAEVTDGREVMKYTWLNKIPRVAARTAIARISRHYTHEKIKQKCEIDFCSLIRDIIGDPFVQISEFQSTVSRDAKALATEIYETKCWEMMPALADALEDTGCQVTSICIRCQGSGSVQYLLHKTCPECQGIGKFPDLVLEHLRSGCEHTRGCWCLDKILGRT